ncbi:hypothetical protein JOE52_006770 [Bradyrhizobium canariense]|nr:hypothetical protein [Bradyrhizobium canariense]
MVQYRRIAGIVVTYDIIGRNNRHPRVGQTRDISSIGRPSTSPPAGTRERSLLRAFRTCPAAGSFAGSTQKTNTACLIERSFNCERESTLDSKRPEHVGRRATSTHRIARPCAEAAPSLIRDLISTNVPAIARERIVLGFRVSRSAGADRLSVMTDQHLRQSNRTSSHETRIAMH